MAAQSYREGHVRRSTAHIREESYTNRTHCRECWVYNQWMGPVSWSKDMPLHEGPTHWPLPANPFNETNHRCAPPHGDPCTIHAPRATGIHRTFLLIACSHRTAAAFSSVTWGVHGSSASASRLGPNHLPRSAQMDPHQIPLRTSKPRGQRPVRTSALASMSHHMSLHALADWPTGPQC
jgi:hypothetical protein